MIYNHCVLSGGKFYKAGTEVPATNTSTTKAEKTTKTTEIKQEEVSVEETVVEETKTYKKSEITQMTVKQLREVASSVGVIDTGDLTGAKLKELIIEKLGL